MTDDGKHPVEEFGERPETHGIDRLKRGRDDQQAPNQRAGEEDIVRAGGRVHGDTVVVK